MSEVMSNLHNASPSCNMCSWGNQVSLVFVVVSYVPGASTAATIHPQVMKHKHYIHCDDKLEMTGLSWNGFYSLLVNFEFSHFLL